MLPIVINAKTMKEDVIQTLAQEVVTIGKSIGRKPKLVIVKATDDKTCEAYIRNKVKSGAEVGVEVEVIDVSYGTAQDEMEQMMKELSEDSEVDSIILQLPIFNYLDSEALIELVPETKDADCFSIGNLGRVLQGDSNGVTPCTPQGVLDILNYHKVKIEGSRVTVIGRSTHVGLSLSAMLTQLGAVVTVTHSKTPDLKEDMVNADIIISCVGKLDLIQSDWMKKGSVLLGVGINFIDGKQYTDYNVDKMVNESSCSLVGDRVNCTGTATVLNLIKNTVKLCKRRNEIER